MQSTPSTMKGTLIRSFFSLWIVTLAWIIIQQVINVSASRNQRNEEKKILDELLCQETRDKKCVKDVYDRRIRPSGSANYSDSQNANMSDPDKDGPCVVTVNIMVRSISKISDLDMEYSTQLTFRQEWTDTRLSFTHHFNRTGIKAITLQEPERIWKPDIFFKNEKEGHIHEMILPNVFIRLGHEGSVLFSLRLSLVLSCMMNLKYYPLDKQECAIVMASYGYTESDIVFVWKEKGPVQVAPLHLPTFELDKNETGICTSKTATGTYSCIELKLTFRREFSFYLIQIYIPCIMLVIVSWVSFWLDPNAIPARVSLGVTTLLTMATQISGINATLPPVSYIKAIDVWTGVCLFFVFGALLEFALVNYASRSDAHRVARKKHEGNDHQYRQVEHVLGGQIEWDPPWQRKWESRLESKSNGFPFPNSDNTLTVRSSIMKPFQQQQQQSKGGIISTPIIDSKYHRIDAQNEKKPQWLDRWLRNFQSRSKRIDVLARITFPTMFSLFNLVYWLAYVRYSPEKNK
ncbi:glutamate-gated chloride channel-like isoform X2 [Brevipalpus obovatus]|uniref:glutamate-gated chloride channel-like isoform X2 n=1 Tax=Brevipalpus obovatus TaxID=246614 RepID=UPI003D9E3FD2